MRTVPLGLALGARCRAERVETRCERGRRLVHGDGVAVTAGEQALAQPRKRLFPSCEVGGMALQALGRYLLALLVLAEALLARGQTFELRGQLGFLRRDELLPLGDGVLELGGALLPPEQPLLARRELALALRDLSPTRGCFFVQTARLPVARVELQLTRHECLCAPVELDGPRLELDRPPLELALAAADALLVPLELGLLALLPPLQQLGVGDLGAEGGNPVLPLAPCLQLAGNPVHALFEALLPVRELLLALRETRRSLGELALCAVEVLKRRCTVALPLFDRLPVEHRRLSGREGNVAPVVRKERDARQSLDRAGDDLRRLGVDVPGHRRRRARPPAVSLHGAAPPRRRGAPLRLGDGPASGPRPDRLASVAGGVRLRWSALPGRPRLAGLGAAGRPVRNRRASRRDDPAVVRNPGADLHGRAARRPGARRPRPRVRRPRAARRSLGPGGCRADRRARDCHRCARLVGGLDLLPALGAPEGHAPRCRDGHARRRRAARGRERGTRGVERRDVLRRRAPRDRLHGRRRLPDRLQRLRLAAEDGPGVDSLDLCVREPGDRRAARLGFQRRGDHGPNAGRRRRDRRRRRAHGEPEQGKAAGGWPRAQAGARTKLGAWLKSRTSSRASPSSRTCRLRGWRRSPTDSTRRSTRRASASCARTSKAPGCS